MKTLFGVILGATGATIWHAQEGRPGYDPGRGIQAVQAADMPWRPAEGLPAGVFVAHATPKGRPGPAVDFVKFPAGTLIPSHWHSANRVVAVLSGRLSVAPADAPDKGAEIGPGGYFVVPGKIPHVTRARDETVVVVSGDGPHDLHWMKAGKSSEPGKP